MKYMAIMALMSTAVNSTEVGLIERLIASVGFPIVVCIFTLITNMRQNEQHAADMKELNKNYAEKVQELTDKHKEEVAELSQAVSNNTIAMQRIAAILEDK